MRKCQAKNGPGSCRAGLRCPALKASAAEFVIRDGPMGKYYAATDVKHFTGGSDVPGSKFTDPKLSRLEDIVGLALLSGKSLHTTDDRKAFIDEHGCSDTDFLDNYRYIRMYTPGTVGAIRSDKLNDDTVLDVVRTKPGASCSLVVGVTEQPVTDVSVVIVTDHAQTGQPMIITAFSGVPTKPVANEQVDALEGTSVTVREVKDILGDDVLFWANTTLINQSA
jgi:hypothetical protein